ncbi:MAG: DUF1837 domain-containing protein, partial [Thermoleophilia bacterium]|nr:DUF1837 domain-containing protein [Thermoleophilia bacterium]
YTPIICAPSRSTLWTIDNRRGPMPGINDFVRVGRAGFQPEGKDCVRMVHVSDVVRRVDAHPAHLDGLLGQKVPLFYRSASKIAEQFGEGFFTAPIADTLHKLPTSEHFRESHFGEIAAGVFAEGVLGLRIIYSKLSLLTTGNANPNNMDLVMYEPGSDPVRFVLGEVKSSMKCAPNDLPARHHTSCFSSVFQSLSNYDQSNLDFDLGLVKDRFSDLPEGDRERIRDALKPYGTKVISYAGFCVVDASTVDCEEASVLATRSNPKDFDVDLVYVEELPSIVDSVYSKLSILQKAADVFG